jgi:hypothetical protein
MKINLIVENDNPFDAGWLACHMGMPNEIPIGLNESERESFSVGFRMRQDTADMNTPDPRWHGECHIAFLMMATNQNVVPFVRAKVSMEVATP